MHVAEHRGRVPVVIKRYMRLRAIIFRHSVIGIWYRLHWGSCTTCDTTNCSTISRGCLHTQSKRMVSAFFRTGITCSQQISSQAGDSAVPYPNRLSGLLWARARTSRFWKIQVHPSDPTTTTSTSDNAVKQSRCRYENTPRRQDDETVLTIAAVPKVFPHQAEACACAEAEPPHPSVDSPQDWQHHQVRPIATLGCSRYRPNGRIDAE
jgi:hypothetical protein